MELQKKNDEATRVLQTTKDELARQRKLGAEERLKYTRVLPPPPPNKTLATIHHQTLICLNTPHPDSC